LLAKKNKLEEEDAKKKLLVQQKALLVQQKPIAPAAPSIMKFFKKEPESASKVKDIDPNLEEALQQSLSRLGLKFMPRNETEHDLLKTKIRSLAVNESVYSSRALGKEMEKMKAIDYLHISEKRKKCIIIEDSYKKYTGIFEKTSKILNPRNPLKKDFDVVDYDMSSEDEWNEENGEDLENRNLDEDEEDEEEKGLMLEDV
jgi:hypothetical protein